MLTRRLDEGGLGDPAARPVKLESEPLTHGHDRIARYRRLRSTGQG
ncbi:MAG: hypothetical protein ACRDRP_07930 [Pseudonocardiaceae bacterium]